MALMLDSFWPLSGAAMRIDNIQLYRRQWLFWIFFDLSNVTLGGVSCFGHRTDF